MSNNESVNFIEDIINEELASGKVDHVATRFPPEPNGCLHIGHAKAVCINFGLKDKYNGTCNLRFDDTNPTKEDVEYVNAIQEDIKWLGFKWDKMLYASDYFPKMYELACELIKKGLAFVCDMSAEDIKNSRGTLTEPGTESPYRNRSVEENLALFEGMKNGNYADGSKVLRAKIDMASPNINMRDPVIYRIVRVPHHRTGTEWVIYPMYDFAHPIEDAIEEITHSCCSLEFEDHRPLYDWVVLNCGFNPRPRQIEFARLNINRTVMSKRYLRKLVDDGAVSGWNDPRMPTLGGMRERGYPPEAIRDFCSRIGVAKSNSEVDCALLEHCVRENLNLNATRVMVVENPIRLIIDNLPEGYAETVELDNNPNDATAGTHPVSFGRELFIDRDDFMVTPPPKYHRLTVGGMVRLKGAYILQYASHKLNEDGSVKEVHCTYIEDSKSGGVNAGIKVKGVIQWVDCSNALDVTLNKYDYLFNDLDDANADLDARVNPNSLVVVEGAKAEKFLATAQPYQRFQFMRMAYYSTPAHFNPDKMVFNLTVGLKDSFKIV